MKSKLFSSLFLLSTFIIAISSARSEVLVDKAQLAANIEIGIRNVLQQELIQSSVADKPPHFSPVVEKRIHTIAQAVLQSTAMPIRKDSAIWLEKSFTQYAGGLHLKGFSAETEGREKEFRQIVQIIGERLNNLNDTKVQKWIAQSQTMSTSAQQYRSDYKKLLLKKLSTAKAYKVNLRGPIGGYYMGAFSLPGFIHALGYRTNDDSTSSIIDIRTNKIDSRILCLALIRYIDGKFKQDALFDNFSYTNIFSAAFEEGDPYGALQEKKFDEIHNKANKILDNAIQNQEDVVLIDWEKFVLALPAITDLRLKEILTETSKATPENQKEQNDTYIFFSNHEESWRLVEQPI